MRRPLSMAIHAALIAGILIAPGARSDTFEVTRGDDPAPNGCLAGDCSLREALEASGSTPGADTIVLGSGLYNVTIGELQVLGEVAIQGAGSTTTNLVATGAFDLLHVMPLGRLTLSGIQMSSSENNVFAEHSEAVLDDVRTPADGGIVLADSVTGGSASVRVTNSNLGDAVGCAGLAGTCHISDSTRLFFSTAVDPQLDGRMTVTVLSSIGAAVPSQAFTPSPRVERVSPPAFLAPEQEFIPAQVTDRVPVSIPVAAAVTAPEVMALIEPAGVSAAPTRQAKPNGKPKPTREEKQEQMSFEPVNRGRFEKSEPTIVDGQDLDVPAFMRMNVKVK